MLSLLKRAEVQALARAGHSELEIARLTGVSVRSIRRIEGEGRIGTVDDAAERRHRRIGRPSEAARFRDLIVHELRHNLQLSSADILRRVRAEGYRGSKTAMYNLVARIRSSMGNPLTAVERWPGIVSRHELGKIDVPFRDRTRARVLFLASWLEFSRWTVVSLLPDSGIESLLRGMLDHFVRFEGVPGLAVLSTTGAVLDGSDVRAGSGAHFALANAVLDLNICVQQRVARKGAHLTGPANRVKRSFFEPARFDDWPSMRRDLEAWVEKVNTEPSRHTGVAPAVRIRDDRAHLRRLTMSREGFALRIPVAIGPAPQVVYEGVIYPVPDEMVHKAATLHVYWNRIVVTAGEQTVERERRPPWAGMTEFGPEPRAEAPEQAAEQADQRGS